MKRGFTLIEVLVTMTIVAVLAGIMVPAVWKIWESQEVQTTKERMNLLKLAIVGDKSLIQSGIRTSYGFVGDIGELPFGNASSLNGLKYLISNPPPSYLNWNGPYLSGFDPDSYATDAWGRRFIYTLRNDLDGYGNRYLSGELRSAGVDGIAGNVDDIVIELSSRDVAPTYRIQGNVAFTNLTGSYRAKIMVTFRDARNPSGEATSTSVCTSTFPNFSSIVREGGVPINLPIGKATITTGLYKGSSCTGTEVGHSTLDYFVSDNLGRLMVNLPVTSVH